MAFKYYRYNWDESRGDEFDSWGKSIWYIEVGSDGYITRQLEVYENGTKLKYSESNPEDEFGRLSDQLFDMDVFDGVEIGKEEFETIFNDL